MQREAFDVVILGGGNAAFAVIGPAREAGLKVAMIEPARLAAPVRTAAACRKKCWWRRRMRCTRSAWRT
jgi:pyruvate/2-oxoglutarate dehydrogenase complex dihydrolipoamide dehydrogenase (E3) component